MPADTCGVRARRWLRAWLPARIRWPPAGGPTLSPKPITGTPDPELYRYGCHARDFWVNLTVGPGSYFVRLKFAARRESGSQTNCFSISLNGEEMIHSLDVRCRRGRNQSGTGCGFRSSRSRERGLGHSFHRPTQCRRWPASEWRRFHSGPGSRARLNPGMPPLFGNCRRPARCSLPHAGTSAVPPLYLRSTTVVRPSLGRR